MKVLKGKLTTNKRTLKNRLLGYNLTDGWIFKGCVYILLISMGYVFLYPLLRMLSMSMMSSQDIIDPEVSWIPTALAFENLQIAINVLGVPGTLFNSFWFSALLAILQTTVSAMTGYAFALYNFKFKKFWFAMVLMTFIIPVPVLIIPRIMMFTSWQELTGLSLIGSIIPQVGLSLLGQGVYSAILILICYNFFRLIPPVLEEAARIDGASAWKVFWNIYIKMSATVLLTVFLFSFVWNWNETFVTNQFVRGTIALLPQRLAGFNDVFGTLSVANNEMTGGNRLTEALQMSGTLISILPLLIFYAFVQRRFIEGIENSGITGE